MKLQNSDFYQDSVFQADKGKEAYFDMMNRFQYPIPEKLRTDEMWVIDFSLSDFVNVGMGGILWCNNQDHGYFGHEIFLPPAK